MDCSALILCAGYGTRMKKLTVNTPKPMLLVNGKPLLEHTILNLKNQGISEIFINLHYLPDKITSYFGDGLELGVSINYISEKKLLGSGGTSKKVLSENREISRLLVIYGDVLTDQNFNLMEEKLISTNTKSCLLLHKRLNSNSIVMIDKNSIITDFKERPENKSHNLDCYVNSGIQLFSREVLDNFPSEDSFDLPRDFYQKSFHKGILSGIQLTGKRVSIDNKSRLEEANRIF